MGLPALNISEFISTFDSFSDFYFVNVISRTKNFSFLNSLKGNRLYFLQNTKTFLRKTETISFSIDKSNLGEKIPYNYWQALFFWAEWLTDESMLNLVSNWNPRLRCSYCKPPTRREQDLSLRRSSYFVERSCTVEITTSLQRPGRTQQVKIFN